MGSEVVGVLVSFGGDNGSVKRGSGEETSVYISSGVSTVFGALLTGDVAVLTTVDMTALGTFTGVCSNVGAHDSGGNRKVGIDAFTSDLILVFLITGLACSKARRIVADNWLAANISTSSTPLVLSSGLS